MIKKQTKHFPFLSIQQQRFELFYLNESDDTNVPSEKQFYQWIWHALKNEYSHAQISLVLYNEDEARKFNHEYRGKDYATNVLSFALNEGECWQPESTQTLIGDLIICPQVVAHEATEQNKPLMHHWAHLVIHGTLHLMGYDHIEDDEAKIMEALETQLLAQLNIANPYE